MEAVMVERGTEAVRDPVGETSQPNLPHKGEEALLSVLAAVRMVNCNLVSAGLHPQSPAISF